MKGKVSIEVFSGDGKNSIIDKINQLISDNEYFKQKQEEYDRKNRNIFQKVKDYVKGE